MLALSAVVAFSTLIGVFREPADKRQITLRNLTFQSVGGGTELFAPLAGLAETVPRQVPYLDGSSYLETLVFPIPRSLWHSKPAGKITGLTHVFDPSDAGLAFPEFGEMYANFGFLGLVLGSILVGLLVEWLWLRLAKTPSLREAVLVSVAYAVLAQLFVRGAIAPMAVTFLGLIIATLVVCRRLSLTLGSSGAARRGQRAHEYRLRPPGRAVHSLPGRRELYTNTIITWLWTQGTLVASTLALPLLTRLLTKQEFGLWSQLLALSAVATIADFGMSSVFVRIITSSAPSSSGPILSSARRFYRVTSASLATVLLAVCLLPGGLISPFLATTQSPRLTAVIVVAAIVVNVAVQPYTIRLLTRGRLDIEGLFGAGPAIVGTLTTIAAAAIFHSSLAVGIAYASVEVGFDLGLIALVRLSPSFSATPKHEPPSTTTTPGWRALVGESWGILIIECSLPN